MNLNEHAQDIVKQFVYEQIKDQDSELWDKVDNDPDAANLTNNEYDLLIKNILAVKVSVH